MGDPLKKVQPGDKLVIPASTFNTFVDVADDWKRSRLSGGRGDPRRPYQSSGVVLVRNDSGADRDRFDIVGVDGPVVSPTDNEDEFANRPVLSCVEPAADHAGRFVILHEPIPSGSVGFARVAGCSLVMVHVTDEDHEAAEIEDGEAGHLASAPTGSAAILWKETGTGEKWALVRFGQTAGTIRCAVPVLLGTWYLDLRSLCVSPYSGAPGPTQKQAYVTERTRAWEWDGHYWLQGTLVAGEWYILKLVEKWNLATQLGQTQPGSGWITDFYVTAQAYSTGGPIEDVSWKLATTQAAGVQPVTPEVDVPTGDAVMTHAHTFAYYTYHDQAFVVMAKSSSTSGYKEMDCHVHIRGVIEGDQQLWKPLAYPVRISTVVAYHDNLLTAGSVTIKPVYRAAPIVDTVKLTASAAAGSPDCLGDYTEVAEYLGFPKYSRDSGTYYLRTDGTNFWIVDTETGTPTNGWKLAGLTTFIGTYVGQGTKAGTSVAVAWKEDV